MYNNPNRLEVMGLDGAAGISASTNKAYKSIGLPNKNGKSSKIIDISVTPCNIVLSSVQAARCR